MEKIRTHTNVFIPMPVVLVGAQIDGRANFSAVAWASRVNANPPMMAVAVNHGHLTARGIHQNGTFSVCLPGADLVAATDYCGLVSGRTVDKSRLFTVFYGDTGTAPLAAECPLCLDCRLVQAVPLPANHLFIGEVVGAYTESRFLTDGNPDLSKMNPFLLTMLDNHYWSLGKELGRAWEAGRTIPSPGAPETA